MRYQFIQQHCTRWPVSMMCRALGVAKAAYYDWRTRAASSQQAKRDTLLAEIQLIHEEVKHRYGSPRMHAELVDRKLICCVNSVAKLMREAGIQAKTSRKYRPASGGLASGRVAENVLARQFEQAQANEAWTADMTYIETQEGWLYLAVVEDLYSRMVVGWSMDSTMTSRLVVDALSMAMQRRLPGEELLVHTDQGSQYASEHYQGVLSKHGITVSMSRKGNCWDNAPMESFFASLKKELVHDEDYPTRQEARASIFEYIEVFYNRVRRHSTLGYVSPEQFEASRNNPK